ncbi:hypothetical protein DFH06DRAFT_1465612 [Mycena polygramma]|nr:hypothetical protein DFH06DRAFT_1465612 [Mycena polygramma]
MSFAFLPFPYLSSYTLPVQFILLLLIVAISYRYRRCRSLILTFLGIYTAYKITGPLIRYGYAAFKALAWFGFYVHFFILGIGYIATGALVVCNALQDFLDGLEGK